MIVSRSRTMHPQSPSLTIGWTVLKESDDLVILEVTFDSIRRYLAISQYFYSPLRVPLERLVDLAFDGVGLAVFKRRANALFTGLICSIPTIVFNYFSLSLLSVYKVGIVGLGSSDWWGVYHSLSALHCRPLLIIIIILLLWDKATDMPYEIKQLTCSISRWFLPIN